MSEPTGFSEGDRYQTRTVTGDPSSAAHKRMHRLLESDDRTPCSSVLEVGANRGEHLPHVRHPWDEYVMLDLTAPPSGVESNWPQGARFVQGDAQDLPFDDNRFDRTIMTCVLHHLFDPLKALQEMRRVTRPGGTISILVPTDPGIAYRTFRALTSGSRARRAGAAVEERLAHALEHRNHFSSLLVQARHVFFEDKFSLRYFPFVIRSWNLNMLTVATIRVRS